MRIDDLRDINSHRGTAFPTFQGFSVKVQIENGNSDAPSVWSSPYEMTPERIVRDTWNYLWKTNRNERVDAKRVHRGDDPASLYYEVGDGKFYVLQLSNGNPHRCDASVSIDGEVIGRWRLEARQDITIERPADVQRRFKFVSESGREAERAGVTMGSRQNGLIKVVFVPEMTSPLPSIYEEDDDDEMELDYASGPSLSKTRRSRSSFAASDRSYAMPLPMSDANVSPQSFSNGIQNAASIADARFGHSGHSTGATVLAGESKQKFGQATPIRLDHLHSVTVNLRLVVPNGSIGADNEPIAVSAYHHRRFETPVPDRIDDPPTPGYWSRRERTVRRDPLSDAIAF